MTNLLRWLMYLGIFAVPYFAIIFRAVESPLLEAFDLEIKLLPVVLVLLFGLYAAGTVLYRVFTFNDCPEAAKELTEQIAEAKKDLTAKGFQFVN